MLRLHRILFAQMPLPDIPCLISGLEKRLAQRHLRKRQRRFFPRGNPLGDAHPLRRLSRHHRRAGRRTDRIGRIRILKIHTAVRQRIDMRRFMERRSIHADIIHAQVIDKKQHDIRRRLPRHTGLHGPQQRSRRKESSKRHFDHIFPLGFPMPGKSAAGAPSLFLMGQRLFSAGVPPPVLTAIDGRNAM